MTTLTSYGRVDWIRTSDHLHPMQVRYRAAPPPEPLPVTELPVFEGVILQPPQFRTANVRQNFATLKSKTSHNFVA